MTVLVALDSFKGSLSAREASEALAQGIRLERPDEEVIVLPVSDRFAGCRWRRWSH